MDDLEHYMTECSRLRAENEKLKEAHELLREQFEFQKKWIASGKWTVILAGADDEDNEYLECNSKEIAEEKKNLRGYLETVLILRSQEEGK